MVVDSCSRLRAETLLCTDKVLGLLFFRRHVRLRSSQQIDRAMNGLRIGMAVKSISVKRSSAATNLREENQEPADYIPNDIRHEIKGIERLYGVKEASLDVQTTHLNFHGDYVLFVTAGLPAQYSFDESVLNLGRILKDPEPNAFVILLIHGQQVLSTYCPRLLKFGAIFLL